MNFLNGKQSRNYATRFENVGIHLDINVLDAQTYYETLTIRKDYDLIFYRSYTNALMPYNF